MCRTSLEITGFLLRAMLLTYPDTPSKHSSALHLCLCNASRLHTIKTDQRLFPGAIHHNSSNTSVSSKMSLYLLLTQSTHPSDPDGVDGRYFAKTNLHIKYNIKYNTKFQGLSITRDPQENWVFTLHRAIIITFFDKATYGAARKLCQPAAIHAHRRTHA